MRRAALLVATAAAALAGCGGDEGKDEPLTVSAASSLQAALTECAGDARLQFAGSDELAAQIRKGVRPDVFAAANTKLPEQLAGEGLLEQPSIFATNRLVVAIAPDADDLTQIEDLGRRGLRVAVGSDGVPIGDYTRTVLDRLPADRGERILANVRTEEPDVKGIVGKVNQGAVDAGFVYRTDADSAKLRAIDLPDELQPTVEYGAAVVKGTGRAEDAKAFVAGLSEGRCADALRAAGFGAPPR